MKEAPSPSGAFTSRPSITVSIKKHSKGLGFQLYSFVVNEDECHRLNSEL